MKGSKARQIHCFFLKMWVSLFIPVHLFFALNSAKKKNYTPMYLRCPALIQKRVSKNMLLFAVGITLPMLMFQIFTGFSLLRIKNFEPPYLYEKLS